MLSEAFPRKGRFIGLCPKLGLAMIITLLANLSNEEWLCRVRGKCTLSALKSARKPSGSVGAECSPTDFALSCHCLVEHPVHAHADSILAS